MITLKPSTLNEIPDSIKGTCLISVYPECIRFQKKAASMLNIPKNKIAFDVSNERQEVYLKIDPEGFQIKVNHSLDYVINSRPLCRYILNLFKATQYVLVSVNSVGSAESYLLSVVNKR